MANLDLAALVTAKSEELEVEYKSWIDTSMLETKAKLARHLAALANHGGGYLIFGVDDKTRVPEGATNLDPKLFGEDAISAIVKRYLDPPFQCRVEWTESGGISYPVVIVPPHGARPVIAIADGPQDLKGKRIGIQLGILYIRSAGPESIAISRPDEWNALVDRCLKHRADILASIMRQAMGSSSKPSLAATDFLKAACRSTAASFAEQIRRVVPFIEMDDQPRVRQMASNFAVFGYALLGEDGEPLQLENLRQVCARADIGMHEYAYFGWNMFLPLHVPERVPQLRTEPLLGDDHAYLEGMQIANSALLPQTFDYWRMYEDGVCCFAESYREDAQGRSDLLVGRCLVKLHSILAHARLVGPEIPAMAKVVIYMEWKGLTGRRLMWNAHSHLSEAAIADDRFNKTIVVDWAEVRDHYFEALKRISLPFFDLVPQTGHNDPARWFNRETIIRLFAPIDLRLKLF